MVMYKSYIVLPLPVQDALMVSHPGERDGRVERDPEVGEEPVEQVVELLADEEASFGHKISHLKRQKVFYVLVH